MSKSDTPAIKQTDDVDPDGRTADAIREDIDAFERLADSELPIAEDAQRALDWLDEYESDQEGSDDG